MTVRDLQPKSPGDKATWVALLTLGLLKVRLPWMASLDAVLSTEGVAGLALLWALQCVAALTVCLYMLGNVLLELRDQFRR